MTTTTSRRKRTTAATTITPPKIGDPCGISVGARVRHISGSFEYDYEDEIHEVAWVNNISPVRGYGVIFKEPNERDRRSCLFFRAEDLIVLKDSDPVPCSKEAVTLSQAEPIPTTPVLSFVEQTERDRLESIIDEGLQTFFAVGQALTQIKEQELWRSTHPSFEAFCRAKFGKGKSYAYEIMGASKVVEELKESGIPDNQLPTNPAQVRALAKLPTEQRPAALKQAIAQSKGKPTAAAIKAVVLPETVEVQAVPVASTRAIEQSAEAWILEHGRGATMVQIAVKLLEWCNAEDLGVIADWIREKGGDRHE